MGGAGKVARISGHKPTIAWTAEGVRLCNAGMKVIDANLGAAVQRFPG